MPVVLLSPQADKVAATSAPVPIRRKRGAGWKHLSGFTMLLSLLWSALVAFAILLGRQAPPLRHFILPASCRLPCLLNVIPGETARQDAFALLVPYTTFPVDQTGAMFAFRLDDNEISPTNGLMISNDMGIVEYIRLYTRRWAGFGLRLGDVMPLAAPSAVYRSCTDSYPIRILLTFEGSTRVSFAVVVHDALSPRSPVTMIEVSTNEAYFQESLASVFGTGCYLPSEWRGFAAAWQYARPRPFVP